MCSSGVDIMEHGKEGGEEGMSVCIDERGGEECEEVHEDILGILHNNARGRICGDIVDRGACGVDKLHDPAGDVCSEDVEIFHRTEEIEVQMCVGVSGGESVIGDGVNPVDSGSSVVGGDDCDVSM